jgi:predicted  nucleic acid-binding Zn-ribbon protein
MALKAAPDTQAMEHRVRSLPEHAALAALAGESTALRTMLAEQQGVLENTRIELGRVDSDVKVVETRIERDSQRLQASSSVKDVAALEQELTALRKRLDDLEEIELAVMERAEQQEAAVAATEAELGAIASRTLEAEAARDVALASIEAERSTASAGRREIASKLPEDLLALYEKQRARYGTGASMLRGGVSLASGVALNQDEMARVRAASEDDVLICPSSDAILVRTGESGL